MRRPDQLDYLQEPDCFHDLFGHVPLLIEPVFADYMQAYGRTALAVADDDAALARLARLYWYTVEFGLIRDPRGTNGCRSTARESCRARARASTASRARRRTGSASTSSA
jgi:phenylalanine-4-hydroxylase